MPLSPHWAPTDPQHWVQHPSQQIHNIGSLTRANRSTTLGPSLEAADTWRFEPEPAKRGSRGPSQNKPSDNRRKKHERQCQEIFLVSFSRERDGLQRWSSIIALSNNFPNRAKRQWLLTSGWVPHGPAHGPILVIHLGFVCHWAGSWNAKACPNKRRLEPLLMRREADFPEASWDLPGIFLRAGRGSKHSCFVLLALSLFCSVPAFVLHILPKDSAPFSLEINHKGRAYTNDRLKH